MIVYGFLAAGLLLLFFGAEAIVRGSATMALRFNTRPLILGLTAVAFGTSSPELLVCVKTALAGHADIAVGTVIGSNIFNIAFILGLCSLIRPLRATAKAIQVDGPILILVSLLIAIYFWDGRFARTEGILLIVSIVIYLWTTLRFSRSETETAAHQKVWACALPSKMCSRWFAGLLILAGIVSLEIGSKIFLKGVFAFQREFGLGESLLGLTLVAAGTAISELVISVWAVIRGDDDLALGSIIGSNVFNSLFVLGASAAAKPLHPMGIQWIDMSAMLLFTVLLVPFTFGRNTLGRWGGALLLLLYASYLVFRFL